ncbi:hypothetical protein [Streptomyces altiplanensis]
MTTAISRLRALTGFGDYAGITRFMTGLPMSSPAPARWLDGEHLTRRRRQALVAARRDHLRTTR